MLLLDASAAQQGALHVPGDVLFTEENVLVFRHRQDELGILDWSVDRLDFGQINLQAAREERSRDHENDEQNQHHVHQRCHVDVAKAACARAVPCGKRHP